MKFSMIALVIYNGILTKYGSHGDSVGADGLLMTRIIGCIRIIIFRQHYGYFSVLVNKHYIVITVTKYSH